MLDASSTGTFQVRIKEFPAFPDIEGKILFIRAVTSQGVQASFTDDCRPLDAVYQLPPEANDNGWYDVTSMIMEANTAIMPRYDKCMFSSDVAMAYRNHLDALPQPLDEAQAVGHICLLGTANNRVLTFSKQAYYVVACDNQGYMLVYSGFCRPLESWEKPNLQQRVLRLSGTARKLYPADAIVRACNDAYSADFNKAQSFATNIKEAASACSTDTDVGSELFSSGIAKLQLF